MGLVLYGVVLLVDDNLFLGVVVVSAIGFVLELFDEKGAYKTLSSLVMVSSYYYTFFRFIVITFFGMNP